MAKHAPRFLRIVEEAKQSVRELSAVHVHARRHQGDELLIVDVREESEWAAGHVTGAIHIGKGVIERDIELKIPNLHAEIVLYCGGGYRSAIAAVSIQQMGYQNVWSMEGGYRGWREAGLPTE
jgi:rhodanese-related sulfurtransferase